MATPKRKSRFIKTKPKPGLAPGSPVFTGDRKMDQTELHLITYGPEGINEYPNLTLSRCFELISKAGDNICWLNVDGLHDEKLIQSICDHLNVHRLSIEDILNVGQRPKMDELGEYVHFVLNMLTMDQGELGISEEQISLLLKGRVVMSFQEKSGDVFDGVRKRIREGKGTIRQRGGDYLVYALLDAVVDHYFVVMERLGERFEDIESALMDNPTKQLLSQIHFLRRESLGLRRAVYPLREAVGRFEKLEEPVIDKRSQMYIRDLYDHLIQVIDGIELFREMANGMLDLYMNSISQRMNEIMKVLTIIATIFIPLTFVAGIYGMNFTYMPELEYRYAYFVILGMMALTVFGMFWYFKKKGWM